MKRFHYIVLIFFLLGCGAKKKQSSKEFELSKTLTSNEILETSKDTLSIQNWSWIKKSNFKLQPKDPEKPSTVQFNDETNTIKFQNATIEANEETEVADENISEGKETISEKNTNDETTDIASNETQSKSREQWKLRVWHLASLLLVIAVVYPIINHRTVIFNFIKRKLSKIINL